VNVDTGKSTEVKKVDEIEEVGEVEEVTTPTPAEKMAELHPPSPSSITAPSILPGSIESPRPFSPDSAKSTPVKSLPEDMAPPPAPTELPETVPRGEADVKEEVPKASLKGSVEIETKSGETVADDVASASAEEMTRPSTVQTRPNTGQVDQPPSPAHRPPSASANRPSSASANRPPSARRNRNVY